MALKGVTLATTDFPLYALSVVGDRHVLVAGGGGAAKTGVVNAIDIFELKRDESDSRVGPVLTARKVTRQETGSRAVMNCAVTRQDKQFTLAAGLDASTVLYSMRYKLMTPKVENEVQEGLRRRKGNLTQSNDHKHAHKMIGFEMEEGDEVVTDKGSAKDGSGFQKGVRFTPDAAHMVTAGADGFLTVWQHPTLTKKFEVKAHTNEIDDLDVSPDGTQIVTASKDNHMYLWKTSDGSKAAELTWTPAEVPYRARSCRFAPVPDHDKVESLYSTHNVVARGGGAGGRKDAAYLVKWDLGKGVVRKLLRTTHDLLSALAVSKDGVYVAVGSISGAVTVHIAFSLQRLYHVADAHRIFVTGLDFAQATAASRAIAGDVDFTLFSISADSQLKVHQQEKRGLYSPLWILAGCLIIMFLAFWFITAFGL